ncbi:YicC/YloC family endoribonuclease [Ichthyobacterium seriolicida]|uniref:YicC family protein n=1 Tax=Ichthyobacterium seriolicida TaxID=242600 RepID=A0A1J1DZ44_9FLAO|nr:YicC/YloC family endoribonuclease [Ichthyobacterium seriolicida]BAV95186.1 hypothetical protein JBKA6_1173 [Ichthyobacterium seriolicida]
MVLSMTGFGYVNLESDIGNIEVCIKSINSKFLDLNIKLPYDYKNKEMEIRNILSKKLIRGKIDFYIKHLPLKDKEVITPVINRAVVLDYIEQLKSISPNCQDHMYLDMALSMPKIFKIDEQEEENETEISEINWKCFENAIELALEAIVNHRKEEGEAIKKDFLLRLEELERALTEIKEMDSDRIDSVKKRLRSNLNESEIKIDENRFEQEVIFYLEKLDITEEIIRLENHCKYFKENLDDNIPNGKKIGFLSQEVGREINTIGSKANYYPMQKLVVIMKENLEKIKEQSLNVL